MINSSDQKKATVADPELQLRGVGGGGGGGHPDPEIREGPGLPRRYEPRWLSTISYQTRPRGIIVNYLQANRYNQTQPTFEIYILQMAVVTHNAICFPTNACKSIVFNFQ